VVEAHELVNGLFVHRSFHSSVVAVVVSVVVAVAIFGI